MLWCFDLIPVCVGLLLLDVHGQHLAAERKALGFLDHLLIWRYSIVAHHHVSLPKERGEEKSVRAKLREHQSFSVPTDTQTCIHNRLTVSSKHTGANSRSFR